MFIRVRFQHTGGHVSARVFVGPDRHHLALAGTVCVRNCEWSDFRDRLHADSWMCDNDASIVEVPRAIERAREGD